MTEKRHRPPTREARQGLVAAYDSHAAAVLAFVRRKVGDGPPEPEDIVQQAFANFAARTDAATVRNPLAFLIKSARNLIFDHFKKASTRLSVTVDESFFDGAGENHDELSPEIVLLGRERLDCVMTTLRDLPERRTRFLLLARVEGLSYTDIARQHAVSISTVRREVEAGVAACLRAVRQQVDDDAD